MADERTDGRWVTLDNGVHLFIKKGQTLDDAIEKLDSNPEKPKIRTEKNDPEIRRINKPIDKENAEKAKLYEADRANKLDVAGTLINDAETRKQFAEMFGIDEKTILDRANKLQEEKEKKEKFIDKDWSRVSSNSFGSANIYGINNEEDLIRKADAGEKVYIEQSNGGKTKGSWISAKKLYKEYKDGDAKFESVKKEKFIDSADKEDNTRWASEIDKYANHYGYNADDAHAWVDRRIGEGASYRQAVEEVRDRMASYDSLAEKYKGYPIEHNFYGNGEYTVQFEGDDVMFDTEEEAKKFIDEQTRDKEDANLSAREYGNKYAKKPQKVDKKTARERALIAYETGFFSDNFIPESNAFSKEEQGIRRKSYLAEREKALKSVEGKSDDEIREIAQKKTEEYKKEIDKLNDQYIDEKAWLDDSKASAIRKKRNEIEGKQALYTAIAGMAHTYDEDYNEESWQDFQNRYKTQFKEREKFFKK